LLKARYEQLFVNYLAVNTGQPSAKALIVHISDAGAGPNGLGTRAKAACAAGWAAATATSSLLHSTGFSEFFEWMHIDLPHATFERAEHDAVVAALRAKLLTLGAGGMSKQISPAAFEEHVASAWDATGSAVGGTPVEGWLRERYWAARSYDLAYADAQVHLRKWGAQVAGNSFVPNFGARASAALNASLAMFDVGVADCSVSSEAMLSQRRSRLQKALQADVQELFSKQHRLLTLTTLNHFKAQLLKVVSRSGVPQQWQQDSLRRSAEKQFDAALSALLVPSLGGPTRQQLNTAFGQQLTEQTSKYLESPPMQLQAMNAMRRRTGKAQKPPRGMRVGLGVVGAARSKIGGGQGNLQTFAGYTSGLNSAHFMFANDGFIPDSSGSEPPPLRFQPKMNFDISI